MLAPTPAHDKGIFFSMDGEGRSERLIDGSRPSRLPRGVRNELQERLKRQAATH
jgi:hypothetical protein